MSGEASETKIIGRPFPKGVSGNREGRPRTHRTYLRRLFGEHGELAADILREIAEGKRTTTAWIATKDGLEEVTVKPTISEQLRAAQAAYEHLNGKAPMSVDVHKVVEHRTGLDASKLSDEELTKLVELLERARPAAELPEGPVVEGELVESADEPASNP